MTSNHATPSSCGPEVVSGVFPLSFSQESLWLEEQITSSAAYNMPEAWRLRGPLNVPALRRAFEAVVERHETLRTVFVNENGRPVQIIRQRASLPLREVFIGPSDSTDEVVGAECRMKFDLQRGPLARALLCRISAEDHLMVVNMHHIICDAWSQALFIRELADHYTALLVGQPPASGELPIQFADFAVWQRETFGGSALDQALKYWGGRLTGAPPSVTLLPDFTRPTGARANEGCTHFYNLGPDLAKALSEFSRARHVTLFATLLAAFKVLLSRHTRETDIVVGCPIAGREPVETERLIGLFVNTHALRSDLGGNPSFTTLLQQVRERSVEAMANQNVPLNGIVDKVTPNRTEPGNPLFKVVFGLQSDPANDIQMPGLRVERCELNSGAAKFDWTVLLSRTAGGISIRSEHRSGLYKETTINRLMRQYEMLLRQILENPEKPISDFDLVAPEERRSILGAWNNTEVAFDRDSSVHAVFAAKAKWHPDRVALVFEHKRVTYAELDEQSSAVAAVLQRSGLRKGERVILSLDRSPDLIIGILGVLKAGGVYVPVDSLYPPDRQELLASQSGARLMLCDAQAEQTFGLEKIGIRAAATASSSNLQPVEIVGSDPAYVMFTSGSTGTPKGVVVTHRAILRLVQNPNYVQIRGEDTFLQFAPAGFDASTFEIWGALLNGARLVIIPSGLPSLSELGRIIRQQNVTILWLTAGLFNQMVENEIESLRGVRQILAGGEALSVPHITKALKALPHSTIINGYGPTENTTFSCCYRIPRNWEPRASVPIGQPISNSHACVLDEQLKLCAVGVPGELFVWGDGLAAEYLERPDLTQASFAEVSLRAGSPPERMYRTGDLGRWLEDGAIEFLGRADSQVKIRGFRIEPGEIESVLTSHPAVRSALVTVAERPSGKHLVAYVISEASDASCRDELSSFAADKLPPYMVPSAFVLMEKFPLTPNGKVDRRALPQPSFEAEIEGTRLAPRSDAERKVARIWEEVLGRNGFDVRQDFFQLGGHSLLATQAASRLSQTFGVDVPVVALFENRTIEALAARLAAAPTREEVKINRHLAPSEARELLNHINELPEEEIERLLAEFGDLK